VTDEERTTARLEEALKIIRDEYGKDREDALKWLDDLIELKLSE